MLGLSFWWPIMLTPRRAASNGTHRLAPISFHTYISSQLTGVLCWIFCALSYLNSSLPFTVSNTLDRFCWIVVVGLSRQMYFCYVAPCRCRIRVYGGNRETSWSCPLGETVVFWCPFSVATPGFMCKPKPNRNSTKNFLCTVWAQVVWKMNCVHLYKDIQDIGTDCSRTEAAVWTLRITVYFASTLLD